MGKPKYGCRLSGSTGCIQNFHIFHIKFHSIFHLQISSTWNIILCDTVYVCVTMMLSCSYVRLRLLGEKLRKASLNMGVVFLVQLVAYKISYISAIISYKISYISYKISYISYQIHIFFICKCLLLGNGNGIVILCDRVYVCLTVQ